MSLLKGFAVGALAGLAGTWMMTNFQTAWSRIEEAESDPEKGDQGTPESESKKKPNRKAQSQNRKSEEPATVKTAEAIGERVLHRELRDTEKEVAGNLVHFAFGTLTGAVYGAAAEKMPRASALDGAAFGTAVWLGADNLAVPALKLSKWPSQVPLSKNAYGFLAHIVYGVSTEITRRILRRVL
jgi:putative membrane protein